MPTTRPNGSLYTKTEGNVAIVEFGHPAGNSLPLELLERLKNEFDALSGREDVHIIVLKSEGEKAFCAGASFNELVAVASPEEGKAFFSGFAGVINAMRKCRKLIVGRVQGKTVGGGVGLSAACDYVLATEAASVKLSELTVGIGPFVIAPAVERKMGKAALAELTLAPEQWKSAYWAKEKGLYARVFDRISELDKEVAVFTEKLASYNPEALAEMKRILWEGTSHWDELLRTRAEVSGKLVLSEFTRRALERFGK